MNGASTSSGQARNATTSALAKRSGSFTDGEPVPAAPADPARPASEPGFGAVFAAQLIDRLQVRHPAGLIAVSIAVPGFDHGTLSFLCNASGAESLPWPDPLTGDHTCT